MTEIIIRTGKGNMAVNMIHRFLTEESYWAKGIPYELVDNSLTHSICVGAFINGNPVGFGRVITDYYTFGWFADFFLLPQFRGRGILKEPLFHIMTQIALIKAIKKTNAEYKRRSHAVSTVGVYESCEPYLYIRNLQAQCSRRLWRRNFMKTRTAATKRACGFFTAYCKISPIN